VIKGRYIMHETSARTYTYTYEMQNEDGSWLLIEEGRATRNS